MVERIYVVTKNMYNGYQRKVAWFFKYKNGIYFEVFAFLMGSHMSYHKDGTIMRTSPAIKKDKIGQFLPLNAFQGWYQLGVTMIEKHLLENNPILKPKERNQALAIFEVDIKSYPSKILNMAVEFIKSNYLKSMPKELNPHQNAKVIIIDNFEPHIVLTILGHKQNLLICPIKDGFEVSHYNSRYSLNRSGVKYSYEAYENIR